MNATGLQFLLGVLPAVMLAAGAIICAVLGWLRPGSRDDLFRWIGTLSCAASITASLYVLYGMRGNDSGVGITSYQGGLLVDRFGVFCSVLLTGVAMVSLLVAGPRAGRSAPPVPGHHALLLLATAAACLLVQQREMVALLAALILLSTCLIALTALVKTSERSAEAALRQLLISGAGLATTAYGLALLYGAGGSTALDAVASSGTNRSVVAVATVLTIAGVTVSLGVPPFWQWAVHAAEGESAVTAGFALTLSMISGVALVVRIAVSGFGSAVPSWPWIVAVLAAAAMLYAALMCWRQTSVRRLVAYAAMGQVGAMLIGVAASGNALDKTPSGGIAATLFGAIALAVGLLGSIAAIAIFEAAGLPSTVGEWRAVGRRSPPTAVLAAVALLALGGAPPLAGFFSRLFLFESGIAAGWGWLVLLALVATVIGSVPLIRLVGAMFAGETDAAPFLVTRTPVFDRAVSMTWITGSVVVVLLAQPLLALAGGGAASLH